MSTPSRDGVAPAKSVAAGGVIVLPGVAGGSINWVNGGNIPETDYGTRFKVQTSTDLVTWDDVDSGDLTENTDGPGGILAGAPALRSVPPARASKPTARNQAAMVS